MKKKQNSESSFTAILQMKDVRDHIYCRTINPALLPEVPRNIPFETHYDFAVTYYIQAADAKESRIYPVTNQIVRKLEMKPQQLQELAWKNTLEQKPAILKSLPLLLGEEETDDPPVYVLTNEEMVFGAVTMLYPGLLDRIARQLESDLCILPSSIHECLILPANKKTDWESLRAIVKKVNDTEVDEAEILSYSVFRYNHYDRVLSIDNR